IPISAPTPANSGELLRNSTSTPQVTQEQMVSSRNLPAFIFTSAWVSKCCTLAMRGHCCSRRLSAGMSLISSSRNSRSSSEGWRSLACCTVARRSRSRRACERRSSNSEATANTPAATSTKTTTAISAIIMLGLPPTSYFDHRFEHRRAHAASRRRQPVGKLGADAGGLVHAPHLAALAQALALEHEDVLHGNDFAFHARDFAHRGHLAGAVGHAGNLHHCVDGGGNLLPDRALGNVQVGHGDHVFDTRQRVARSVGVHRGQRALVAGVHGLQHVERLLAADFAHHYAVGTHTQAVDYQLPLADGALAFNVG